jgi:uncharacterized membrane protein YdjX (TVP38/TMEM64 family)
MKGNLRFAPIVLIVAVMAAAFAMGWHRQLSAELLYEHRSALKSFIAENLWGALALYMLVYAAVVALSLPGGLLLTVSGGFLFGWLVATPAIVVSATIGATLIFLAVRTATGEALAKRAGPFIEKLRAGFQKDALSYLLFLRLVPAFPFWLINVAPALLGVPLRTYLVATFFGIIPGTLAFAFAGSGLDSVLSAQGAPYEACKAAASTAAAAAECRLGLDLKSLVTPQLLAAFALLGAVALIPVLVKRFRRAPVDG